MMTLPPFVIITHFPIKIVDVLYQQHGRHVHLCKGKKIDMVQLRKWINFECSWMERRSRPYGRYHTNWTPFDIEFHVDATGSIEIGLPMFNEFGSKRKPMAATEPKALAKAVVDNGLHGRWVGMGGSMAFLLLIYLSMHLFIYSFLSNEFGVFTEFGWRYTDSMSTCSLGWIWWPGNGPIYYGGGTKKEEE